MLVIIDYGAGNLNSVKKALEYCGAACRITSSPALIKNADRVVLPGVGDFGAAMKRLNQKNIADSLRAWMEKGRPFLGICLGMQLLFDTSTESPGVKGLAVLEGTCDAFKIGKVPQIGWNRVRRTGKTRLLASIADGSFFYFLHGYYVRPRDVSIVKGTTDYGSDFVSVIETKNICAVQFHPEKSGDVGLRLLKNWVHSC